MLIGKYVNMFKINVSVIYLNVNMVYLNVNLRVRLSFGIPAVWIQKCLCY